jgi:ABC-type transport system substrate-binding protein
MRRRAAVLLLSGLTMLAGAGATAFGSGSAERILRLNVSDYRLETFDPALGYDFVTWRLANMTCLKLMSYPDKGGTAGSKLIPEASFPPRVSADGRTYSFTVRSGLRFADGRAITAESFAARSSGRSTRSSKPMVGSSSPTSSARRPCSTARRRDRQG